MNEEPDEYLQEKLKFRNKVDVFEGNRGSHSSQDLSFHDLFREKEGAVLTTGVILSSFTLTD